MKKNAADHEAVTLSRARALLSGLVRDVSSSKRDSVPISVRGRIEAYVVGAKRLAELEALATAGRAHARPPIIRGTLSIVSPLDLGSREAANELEQTALRSWDRAMKR